MTAFRRRNVSFTLFVIAAAAASACGPVVGPTGVDAGDYDLAFVRSPQGLTFVMHVDGSDLTQAVVGLSSQTALAWSPDGKRLALSGEWFDRRIWATEDGGDALVSISNPSRTSDFLRRYEGGCPKGRRS
jgi:sugar lactone lactonase YvrE